MNRQLASSRSALIDLCVGLSRFALLEASRFIGWNGEGMRGRRLSAS
jgi:hypothetical protein